MSKQKVELNKSLNIDLIFENLKRKYSKEKINTQDGLKIDFNDSWVQLRKSNTEPIVRVYSEAKTQNSAEELASKFINEINKLS